MAPHKKPTRKLTPQEKHLWGLVTKDVAKLNQVERAMSMDELMASAAPQTLTKQSKLIQKPRIVGQSGMTGRSSTISTRIKTNQDNGVKRATTFLKKEPYTSYGAKANQEKNPSVFAQGDPAMERRVARGRMRIDACLDLHGHTQIEALQRLHAFITLARHQQARCVLVVTGKGRESQRTRLQDLRRMQGLREARDFPQDKSETFNLDHAPRGVLRTRFLEWVEQAPLRDHIIRVSGAKPRDGGTGAFYVFLKKSL